MSSTVRLLAVLLAVHTASPASGLSYVESSQGLVPPQLEGGRTEVEFADLDRDGNVDLVSIGDHGNPYVNTDEHGIMVWFGDGQGIWSCYQTGNFGYGGIAIGDLNADGLWDAAYGMHHNYAAGDLGNQILEAALGDGTGRIWTAWDDGLAGNGEDWGMFGTDLADIDNDGDLDIGSNSFGCCAGVHVYRNDGDGTWTQAWGFLGGNSEQDFLFGDVNADGFADLVAAHASGAVYLGDGNGGFTIVDGNLPGGGNQGRRGPSLGDIDNDGDLDIAFRASNASLQVWRWNGVGAWVDASAGLPTSGIAATQLADMDGDGWVDVIGLGNGVLRVWLGNGGTAWTLATTINLPSPGYFAALRVGGDVDHNGRPDIAVVSEEGNWPSTRNHFHLFRESTVASVLAARFVRPRGGERLAGGSQQFVDWISSVPGGAPGSIDLDLSTSGPLGPWTPVASGLADGGRYQWRVPVVAATASAFLRVRVHLGDETAEAVTPRAFEILPPTAAAVEEGSPDEAPLSQAFPNPTGGAVTFKLVTGPAPQAITIFDTAGRLVRVLGEGNRRWDGQDQAGRDLPPGLYYARAGLRTIPIVRIAVPPEFSR